MGDMKDWVVMMAVIIDELIGMGWLLAIGGLAGREREDQIRSKLLKHYYANSV